MTMSPLSRSRSRQLLLICCTLLWSATVHASEPPPAATEDLRTGHWVEVRGHLDESSGFVLQRIDLLEPRSYPRLWGVAQLGPQPNTLLVLDRVVEITPNTRIEGKLESFVGQRVRVQGSFGARHRFRARSIVARQPGTDRILGRISSVRSAPGGVVLDVHGFEITVPATSELRSEGPVFELERTAPLQIESPYSWVEDVEDLLGDGFRLAPNVGLRLRQDVTTVSRRNFELDQRDDSDLDPDDDLDDSSHNLRFQLVWTASQRTSLMVDARHRLRYRDARGQSRDDDDLRLNEAWLLVRDIGWGIDLQVGRTDYDDPREWVYDQNLDGLRLFKNTQRIRWDLGLSTTALGGSRFDRSATNLSLYAANKNGPRHVAAYVVHRSFGEGRDLERTHVGARLIGPVNSRMRVWSDVSLLSGSERDETLRGWGVDLGATLALTRNDRTRLSLGYARGSGDRPGGTRTEFRQTGLHDNDARLGGLAAVRYYGELLDPELSNLEIATISLARLFGRRVSIELLGHRYRQVVPTSRLRSDIDQRPSGLSADLGWEADLVLAFRRFRTWDFEIVGSHFEPGQGFPDAEPAQLLRFQVRYRY